MKPEIFYFSVKEGKKNSEFILDSRKEEEKKKVELSISFILILLST